MTLNLSNDEKSALKRIQHGYKIDQPMFDRLVEFGVARQFLGGPGVTDKGRKALLGVL